MAHSDREIPLKSKLAHVHPHLFPGGGPAGYLYGLASGLEAASDQIHSVDVVSMAVSHDRSSSRRSRSRIYSLLDDITVALPAVARHNILLYRHLLTSYRPLPAAFRDKLLQYGAVVFHHTQLLARYLRTLPTPRSQKLFLMSHGPTDAPAEIVDGWLGGAKNAFASKARERLAALEKYAYASCDGIIAPSRHALQDHFAWSPKYRSALLALPVFEVASGAVALKPSKQYSEVRRELQIGEERRVVGFFGRYHPDKGYDLYCDIAKALKQDQSITFISAGAGVLKGRGGDDVRDLGWRSDVADLVGACDVVALPNRCAYFDLLLLEAMSLGRPVVAFGIGGHQDVKSKGVLTVAPNDIAEFARTLQSLTREQMQQLSTLNLEAFHKEYTVVAMVKRHDEFAKLVLETNGIARRPVEPQGGTSDRKRSLTAK